MCNAWSQPSLAKDFRVICWDRRNTDGKVRHRDRRQRVGGRRLGRRPRGTDRALELGPFYVGEYAGCRITPLLCLKYPELVKGLMLAWPSGGDYAAEEATEEISIGNYIRAALRQGMAGVIEIDRFAASIAQKEANRTRLLAMDAQEFARQMAYWAAFFDTSGDLPIAGCRATEQEWASIESRRSWPAASIRFIRPRPRKSCIGCCEIAVITSRVVDRDEWSGLFNVVPFPQCPISRAHGSPQCGGISSKRLES